MKQNAPRTKPTRRKPLPLPVAYLLSPRNMRDLVSECLSRRNFEDTAGLVNEHEDVVSR